ncbi:hypothetical protein [Bradyrhizobium shewense]|uniref:hypothetical protein n=1 Tax=Bradyrhizobium shewense TaxID=1761772 RepID=UPI001FD97053|nr:hypothetical protein [Bradyrhizobium shewense]
MNDLFALDGEHAVASEGLSWVPKVGEKSRLVVSAEPIPCFQCEKAFGVNGCGMGLDGKKGRPFGQLVSWASQPA